MAALKVGDQVEIADDIEIVQQLQMHHGGWTDEMKEILGRKGKVVKIFSNDNLCVKIGNNIWTLNPACCAPSAMPWMERRGTDHEPDSVMKASSKNALPNFFQSPLAALKKLAKRPRQRQSEVVTKIRVDNANDWNGDFNDSLIRAVPFGRTMTNAKDRHGSTALHRAVLCGDVEKIPSILQNGAAINEINAMGSTALHLAVEKRNPSSVSILLQHGCDVNIEDSDGNTPLHKAVEVYDARVTEKLLNHECANHGIINKMGFNVLQYAASCGNVMVVTSMLSLTPYLLNLKSIDGLTPLHLAVVYDHIDIAKILIAEGKVDTELHNNEGLTPLLLAVSLGRQQIACVLVDYGANISAQDNEGNTCLHYVARAVHTSALDGDVLRYLLNKGADISKMNRAGQCSIDVASTEEVLFVLLMHIPDKGPGRAVSRHSEVVQTSRVERRRPKRSPESEQNLICELCTDRRKDTALDCGHTICNECAQRIESCAVCRRPISNRLRLFF